MSMHKKPLTDLEEKGLRAHGLDIGTPSQLSDVFRQGIAWCQTQEVAELERQLDWMDNERKVAQQRLGIEKTGFWLDVLDKIDVHKGYEFSNEISAFEIKLDQPALVGGAIFTKGCNVGTVIQAAFDAYRNMKNRHKHETDEEILDKEFLHPLFIHKMPMATQLRAVAAQEGNDGPDYDLMMAAAEHIDRLVENSNRSMDRAEQERTERHRQAKKFSDDLAEEQARFNDRLTTVKSLIIDELRKGYEYVEDVIERCFSGYGCN